jgi:hypothetical protein
VVNSVVAERNSQWLAVDDQGYVMQFTHLISSKAMTDAVGPPQISKCSIMKLKLRALRTRPPVQSHASMTIKICTTASL